MSIADPTARAAGNGASGRETLSLSNVFHDCLAPAIIAINANRTVAALNSQAESITGLKASEVLEKSISSLPVPLQTILRETFENGRPVVDRQIVLSSQRMTEARIQARTFLHRNEQREITAVLLLLHDISSAKELETKLRRLDRLANTGILSASAGHEIKNALVAIKTFVDVLVEQNHDAELSTIVSGEVQRIDSIISRLLKFAGPPTASFSAVRLHEVVESSLLLIQHQLSSQQIRLTRAFKVSNDLVQGDEIQLRQALINLLLNAIEASNGNGKLHITTELVNASPAGENSEQRIRLAIQDTGSGIAPEDLPHLYQPFFTTKPKGTGLGLAITQRIIHEHGGTIAVESEVNKGTIFTIFLPVLRQGT